MGVAVSKNAVRRDCEMEPAKRGYQGVRDPSDISVTIPHVVTQFAISARIDKSIQREKIDNERRVNILLLGGADAGKSTILNQMRILHMDGFSDLEMSGFHKNLMSNVFEIFHEVALGLLENFMPIADSEKDLVDRFTEHLAWFLRKEDKKEKEHLLNFQKLKCVQSYLDDVHNYSSLPDNAHFYLPKLTSLLAYSYVPTAEDILHLRVPTTAVNEINFSFDTTKIRLIDVGGQRTYRKKWIHCFEGVSAVMFVASMAAYDQALDKVDILVKPVLHKEIFSAANDAQAKKLQNRLRDSAHLFGETLRSKFLVSSAFILFLNKKDLFAKKLKSRPLAKYYNGYYGSSVDEASEFLKDYFLKRKSTRDKERTIYSHFTCATDTKNVEFVFKAACDIILQKNLAKSGIA